MRAFIGIPLDNPTKAEIAAVVSHLRSIANQSAIMGSLRWSAAESWHITLQFLGSTTPEQYECVAGRLRELRESPFSIELGEVGTFDRAGVLFLDVRVSPQLLAFQQAVTAATAPCGFIPENRPYHPHITLARRKGRGRDGQLHSLKSQIIRQPSLSSFIAVSFLLYESISTPEGSRYEVRERLFLAGPHGR